MNTYWNGNGKYQDLADKVHKLLPAEGGVAAKCLEKYRIAANLYYQIHNNGCFSWSDGTKKGTASSVFHIKGRDLKSINPDVRNAAVDRIEDEMDRYILNAAKEAGML